ncbi:MAG TPA: hypothetical protein DEO60_13445 [Bacteroidales bacterium]|jgi:hypothetical protein|nr:hypothetical protein [Bacteroidales bacterium]
MPSIRKLKKSIDYLIFEVISDCFTFGTIHPEDHAEEVSGIIADAVSLRNDLIRRANNPEKNDLKSVRTHFQLVEKDLFVGTDKLCTRLSDLHGKVK